MTSSKTTKRALLSSVLALTLCFAMLLGMTYAWFTDSAVSKDNKVQAGTLDVQLKQWTDADTSVEITESSSPLFTEATIWEPGRTEIVYLSIKNNGSLDLKYKVALETKTISDHDMREVMSYAITPDAKFGDVDGWLGQGETAYMLDTESALTVATEDVSLEAGAEHFFALSVHMDEEAGNVYMNDSIVFDIKVLAGQLASEKDGFDNDQYDADAPYFEQASEKVVRNATATADETLATGGKTPVSVTLAADIVNAMPAEVTAFRLAHAAPEIDETAKTIVFNSMEILDQNENAIDLSENATPITVSFPVPFEDGMTFDVYHDNELICAATVEDGMITYEALHFCVVRLNEAVPVNVSTSEALQKVLPGQKINLTADIDLGGATVFLPAGVSLNGNGHQINGTIAAGGDLTIDGHVKVTSFSASYYNRIITISEGGCLEVTGTGRVTLGYGNTFNIIGTVADAKTADKASIQPSLIIPGGISITGGNDAVMNVTNAYVKIGSTSSKNSVANGTFTLNFNNAIAEFTNQFTLAEPTNGNNPTFNINIVDSVFTTAAKLCAAAPNSNIVIDNSTVTLATYLRNSGEITLKNGSTLTGKTIQFGENGGNNGKITVDASTFEILAGSTGHAFDGKGIGSIVATNGANVTVDYYKAMTIDCDTASTFAGTEVK